MNLVITSKEELTEILRSVIIEIEKEKEAKKDVKLLSINAVAKKLGLAHSTIKKLATSGVIKTTASGLISEGSVEEYLRSKS